MRTSGDDYGEYAASSKSYEERRFKDDDSNSRPGSQRSIRSSSKEEETSSNKSQHTDQKQDEILRKLESLKGHVIRGGGQEQPKGFQGHGPYYNPYPEPFPYGMYPPSTSNPTHAPVAHRDPYGFPMHRKPQNMYQGPGQYPIQMLPRPSYPQGQYVDIGPDIFDPQLQDPRFFPVTPNRYGDVPYNSPIVHHVQRTGPFSPHGGVQGQHTRWPSENDSESAGAFPRGFDQKVFSDFDSLRIHPLAGGAPFIACHNCFELLYLPKEKLLAQQTQQKLQCGACSELISYTTVNKKLVFSSSALPENRNRDSVEVDGRSTPTTVLDDCPLKDEEQRKHLDTKIVQTSEHSDEEESSSNSSEPQKLVVNSVKRRVKGVKVPPPPPENSNLLELFEYSNVNRAALTYGMAQLGYNKQDSYMKQESLKSESVATETNVSYNRYHNNTEVSEDSRISRTSKGSRPRNQKESSEYSFAEVTNRVSSNDQYEEQLEVWVNGYLIPEDLVISAEKQAGPIQAGKYWYDYRAGFWGVIGTPCLGIIPPFIEEFSRPMPDKCGAGNTSVFVNGRELHERDFELLARRGLPREKNRSYIVDISGRVLDGESGEELKSLGKLAPTYAFQATLYHIWRERNSRLHGQNQQPARLLVRYISKTIRNNISAICCLENTSYTTAMELWYASRA